MSTVTWTLVVAAALTATMAAAQSANPPGNTLAPATGTVTTTPAPPPVAPAPDKAPAAPPAQLAAAKAKPEMVCKTTIETGSLIARRKTCLTAAQWRYVNDENERAARKVVDDNAGRPTSN